LVLVDDHPLFREGLAALLSRETDLAVVGEAADARGAYEMVEAIRPDVVLVDVGLPGVNGIAVVRELVRRDRQCKALVLTMHGEEEFVAQALSAGAAGYALKHQPFREVCDAIREVAGDKMYLSPRISRIVVDDYLRMQRGNRAQAGPLALLSPREREVFDMLVRGYTNDGVGRHLSISVKTVETHRAHILKKLRLHSIAELIRFAVRHNLVSNFGAMPSELPHTLRPSEVSAANESAGTPPLGLSRRTGNFSRACRLIGLPRCTSKPAARA
jgi:DNA-binding NarL/FixJ family response regulator